MSAPKISVVIPAYNRERTIRAAIESVLGQTEKRLELLVVDDASSDKTADIARSFNDARVEVIQHRQNGGVSAARNTGITAARGQYIALLDSDDLWFPKMLESQLARLEAAPTKVGGIVSDHVYVDQERRPHYIRRNSTSSRSPDELIVIGHGMGMGQSLVAPRGVFETVGPFDPALPRAEDWEWMLRFRRQHEMLINPQILFAYEQSSFNKPEITRKCVTLVHDRHAQDIAAHDGPKMLRKFEAAVDWKLARTEIAERHWDKGLRLLKAAAQASPDELLHYGARLVRDKVRVLVGGHKAFDNSLLQSSPRF
ncbi:MAG: glycosyltransferase family 2 protein [Alphaproteobacteria bacterium]|nr:glycosyltransferase family 2 protein [Alphaproteobacteria bacterium]